MKNTFSTIKSFSFLFHNSEKEMKTDVQKKDLKGNVKYLKEFVYYAKEEYGAVVIERFLKEEFLILIVKENF